MAMLPPSIQELYDLVVYKQQPDAAWGIVESFCEEYDTTDAHDELWRMITSVLISPQQPHMQHAEEREYLLTFYEYLKALMLAVHVLHKHTNRNLPSPGVEEPCIKADMDKDIQSIVHFLVTTIQPQCIYRIPMPEGCNMLDLVIVMPANTYKSFSYYEKIIDIAGMRKKGFRFSLHDAQELYGKIKKGNLFYAGICRQENRLYANAKEQIAIVKEDKRQAMAAKATAVFTANHTKALTFMEGAKFYKTQSNDAMTAFMLHQCIELCFRGVVLAMVGYDPRTHSIITLLKHTQRYAIALNEILPYNTDGEKKLLHLLDSIYADSRYVDEFVITPMELAILFKKAEKVLVVSEEVCTGIMGE